MKITILCENQAGHNNAKVCLAEWGFSAFIRIKCINILLDAGHTDVYRHNAEMTGIDLEKTDFIILSHHHWDHIGGLLKNTFHEKKRLIFHPDIMGKLLKAESDKINNDFLITASSRPLEFAPEIFFLGQIPRTNSFEKGRHRDDAMLDDTALAVKTDKGAVVITGCSHSGICNICEYAKKVTGQKLHAVIGGFHLFKEDPEAVEGTIAYFKKEDIENLYPMHCIDMATLCRFYSEFAIEKLCAGDSIVLNC
ncbi:MAG: MBL fold metallo-hydrolase [Spirochaetia bacterium]|nr:MBL fold metallo-hydrolase [Spirochaetia bacterium]